MARLCGRAGERHRPCTLAKTCVTALSGYFRSGAVADEAELAGFEHLHEVRSEFRFFP